MAEREPHFSWWETWRLGAWRGQLLLLFLLLSPGVLESSRSLYSEIIIPEQLDWASISDSMADRSYLMTVEGRKIVVHLKQITFITSSMPVYSYNVKGDLIVDYPHIQDNCYYRGFVDSVPDSQVILSACPGLWGHLQIETLRYDIQPIESSRTFQHLIYRKAAEQRLWCGNVLDDHPDFASGKLRMVVNESLSPSSSDEHSLGGDTSVRYLEYYAVVDRSKFITMKRNETAVVLLVAQLMASVHAMYFGIGLHIYLVGLELWTERDIINIDAENLHQTLTEFHDYATRELQHRVRFDHAGLITTQGSLDGLAQEEHICIYSHASVSAMSLKDDVTEDSLNIAHQLGHSLGFGHDDGPGRRSRPCDCNCTKAGKCLMAAELNTIICLRLSNCSREIYYNSIRQGKECLLNPPSKPTMPKMCGNGIIDENEECDCGIDEEIEGEGILTLFLQKQPKGQQQQWIRWSGSRFSFTDHLESKDLTECRRNSCCQKDCTIKQDTNCLYGLCCEKCKFAESGTPCRESATECDLPEYCNGTSAECPADMHKQDGMPCGTSDLCYRGNCHNLQRHCTALFGQDAQVAPLECFKEVNMQGDRSGNCGMERRHFKKCQKADALCGRIQCVHVKSFSQISAQQGVIQTPVQDTLCWGTEFHFKEEVYDLGAVRDGTPCGAEKVCLNRSCVDRALLNYDCDLSKCHNRGVCNSRRNCHCSYGWAPPFCKMLGHGGSIDSGPPTPLTWTFALVITRSLLLILILVFLFVFTIWKREDLTSWFTSVKRFPQESANTESMQKRSLPAVQTLGNGKPSVKSEEAAESKAPRDGQRVERPPLKESGPE